MLVVPGGEGYLAAARGLSAPQSGDPDGGTIERASKRANLAHVAAGLARLDGMAEAEHAVACHQLLDICGIGRDDADAQAVALLAAVEGLQRLGKVPARVEREDVDVGRRPASTPSPCTESMVRTAPSGIATPGVRRCAHTFSPPIRAWTAAPGPSCSRPTRWPPASSRRGAICSTNEPPEVTIRSRRSWDRKPTLYSTARGPSRRGVPTTYERPFQTLDRPALRRSRRLRAADGGRARNRRRARHAPRRARRPSVPAHGPGRSDARPARGRAAGGGPHVVRAPGARPAGRGLCAGR